MSTTHFNSSAGCFRHLLYASMIVSNISVGHIAPLCQWLQVRLFLEIGPVNQDLQVHTPYAVAAGLDCTHARFDVEIDQVFTVCVLTIGKV